MSWCRRVGAGSSFAAFDTETPSRFARAENNPPLKVFSKWPESKEEAEALERTQGAHVLALEGQQAAATDHA